MHARRLLALGRALGAQVAQTRGEGNVVQVEFAVRALPRTVRQDADAPLANRNLVLFLVSMLLYVVLIRKASSSSSVVAWIREFLYMLCSINVSLAVFNLLPIPPLDGYHVVNDILLKGRLQLDYQTFRIAQIVLLVLCFSGALSGILSTVNNWLMNSAFRFFLSIIH